MPLHLFSSRGIQNDTSQCRALAHSTAHNLVHPSRIETAFVAVRCEFGTLGLRHTLPTLSPKGRLWSRWTLSSSSRYRTWSFGTRLVA